MENTTEDKKKYFGLYYGQNVRNWTLNNAVNAKVNPSFMSKWVVEHSYLSLTSPVNVSHPHAIKLAERTYSHPDNHTVAKGIALAQSVALAIAPDFCLVTASGMDFLRREGYATPYDTTPLETLIEWGWVKIKTS